MFVLRVVRRRYVQISSTHRGQILLGEPLRLAALHDQLGHVVRHGPMLQLVRFPVQLGGVLRCRMLLVGAGINCNAGRVI